jgi:hypothetical protein
VVDVLANYHHTEPKITIDTQYIDMLRVGGWISHCDKNYAGICHSRTDPWETISPPAEMILINVQRQCLERITSSPKYVALSYVWGNAVDPLLTLQENFAALYEDGALDSQNIRAQLPDTIRPSILLTSVIGQKYLWVDRLCIIQDNNEHKSAQLNHMAAIYGNASITIVAAEGEDDTFGIRGITVAGPPRNSPFQQVDFAPTCRLVTSPKLKNTKYDTRGWTLQEEMLSPRQLIFRNGTVNWNCRLASCAEYQAVPQARSTFRQRQENLFTKRPNVSVFITAAVAYSGRQLTYVSDTLAAFSGVLTVLSRSMVGGLLFAMPELFFERMPLWQPLRPLKRRNNAENNITPGLPSWSGISWEGELDPEWWRACKNLDLRSTTVWYKQDSTTGIRVRIDNVYHNYKEPVNPINGARVKTNDTVLPTVCAFRHLTPIASPLVAPSKAAWSPILNFCAQRLSLIVGSHQGKLPLGKCVTAFLKDPTGLIVGAIRLNSELSMEGVQCELICISRARGEEVYKGSYSNAEVLIPELMSENFKNKLWSRKQREATEAVNKRGEAQNEETKCIYKFYNVLWVRWEDGIAYRMALGRVEQDYWDSAPTEEIDVRLG